MERKPPLYADLPIPELLKQLSNDLVALARNEATLARLEIAEKSKGVGPAIGLIACALVFVVGAFVTLTIALVGAFATFLQLWAAGLCVTALYLALAGLAGWRAKVGIASAAPPIPEAAIASIKADVEAVRSGLAQRR